ncbi:hypothetical protein ZIOFF_043797 [Zingiber officinale]|uniref:Mon2/Sec7/BIG1-like HDS domain-containing protein n=1 Tax=Zingiber officinale TaxID=94328 RepID=A0A8J5FW02_ZINOF|nr:hypothetical protein ZIOFF_043797 [Zingiber officinale]
MSASRQRFSSPKRRFSDSPHHALRFSLSPIPTEALLAAPSLSRCDDCGRAHGTTVNWEWLHYNMNHIRLVWSCIWNVLSEFFVSVGLSENLSVAIFVMDSLRQLAMKFLEREELANYNFQNEFLKPFVVIMQKSNSFVIRELIVRCVSQMILSCVNHVKSGWKSVFMVFTTAVVDDRSLHCLLTVYTWKKCTLRD